MNCKVKTLPMLAGSLYN